MKQILIIGLCVTTLFGVIMISGNLNKDEKLPSSVLEPIDQEETKQPEEIVTQPLELSFPEAVDTITSAELKNHVYFLADESLSGRMSGKWGNRYAAGFIRDAFDSYGLKTMFHEFSIANVNPEPNNAGDPEPKTNNIYGWVEGSDLKDEVVIVGAHMDHIGFGPRYSRAPNKKQFHPGADDNASGTAALLEIAQAFSTLKGKVRRTVVFQAYSAEEMGLLGSIFYCENPQFPQSSPSMNKHVAMINMDMIGRLRRSTRTLSFEDGRSSADLNSIMRNLNQKYPFGNSVASRGGGGSDHAPFYNKRIPVVFLHTGTHGDYHTPSDTPDKINYDGMQDIARYAFELAWEVSNADNAPKFNKSTYAVMSYDHDHGNVKFEE